MFRDRCIQPSKPRADPNSQAAAGVGTAVDMDLRGSLKESLNDYTDEELMEIVANAKAA